MIFSGYEPSDEIEIIISCDCGNEIIRLSTDKRDPADFVYLTFYEDCFSAKQGKTLWERVKRIWEFLTKGEYFLFEMCLKKRDIEYLITKLPELLEKS